MTANYSLRGTYAYAWQLRKASDKKSQSDSTGLRLYEDLSLFMINSLA